MTEGADPRIRLLERIVVDTASIDRQPRIRGTGVRVSEVLEWMAAGIGPDEIIANFPQLSRDDLTAALLYGARASSAADVLQGAGRAWVIFVAIALIAGFFLGFALGAGGASGEDEEAVSNPQLEEAGRRLGLP